MKEETDGNVIMGGGACSLVFFLFKSENAQVFVLTV